MKELNKSQYLQSQMMIAAGLLDHTKDNLEETCFEDDPVIFGLVASIEEGIHLVIKRMIQCIQKS
jgi:hypothetical protein